VQPKFTVSGALSVGAGGDMLRITVLSVAL